MKIVAFAMALLFLFGGVASADEGMWTLDHFPSKTVGAKYGFTPSQAWLDHIRSSALRIAGGCSASFISPGGLVMTNHHCAVDCENSLSTATSNLVQTGFYAKTPEDESKCPGFEIDQLLSIQNVTAEMLAATKGLNGAAFTAATRAENAKIQKRCGGTDPAIRCDVVSLYHGGIYDVYKYRRFSDVRLVFAPEFAVAQFGGDVDNFNFPRFDFDIALLRVYVGGKPAATPSYLRWSKNGSKAGDLVFVAGNPGATQRELTIAQLSYLRDVSLPQQLAELAELRGLLEEYQTLGPEQQRTTNDELFFIENDYKVVVGQLQALDDPALFSSLVAKEQSLRQRVDAQPALRKQYGDTWNRIAALMKLRQRLDKIEEFKSGAVLEQSTTYFAIAQTLVRAPVEKAKPNAQRLPEFSDAALAMLPYQLFDPSPIYPAVEQLNLTFGLDTLRRAFGPADPFVQTVLGGRSPADQAQYLVANTKLGDVAVRKQLYQGGEPAIQASTDSFIKLARDIDAQTRAVRKQYEDQITNPTQQLSEAIAKARFAILGTSVYPDATFTLRLSYGKVAGFTDSTGVVPPFTTIGGLFARASNAAPYVLPQSWIAAKSSLNLQTPMNLSSTNDIIGGNSGSPLIDKNGDVVGLIFDGNIHSLGGAFGYDPVLNRAVSLDSRAIIAGLTNVYHADRIVTEILNSR
jgi:hypothetical protein